MNRFNVYIVESPSPDDFYKQNFEGNALMQGLKLDNIASSYHQTVDLNSFKNAFRRGLVEYYKKSNDITLPILHISAHGDKDGIQLTSGERLIWDELRELLIPINESLSKSIGLILCLSTCYGLSGMRMAMKDDSKAFGGIVANNDKPAWNETYLAYSVFYHLFRRGETVEKCITAMRLASGNSNFHYITQTFARQAYLLELKKQQQVMGNLTKILPDIK